MSEKLRGYYRGCVVPVMQSAFYDIGYDLTQDETHEALKDRFLEAGSTKGLTNKEWLKFLARIQRFAATFLNVQVPDPNELTELITK